MQYIIISAIFLFAIYILVKHVKKELNGEGCDCSGGCNSCSGCSGCNKNIDNLYVIKKDKKEKK